MQRILMRDRGALGVVALAGMALAGVACERAEVAPPEAAAARSYLEGRRECPKEGGTSVKPGAESPALSGPGNLQHIPEFHDCQRFIVDSAGTLVYDSLFAVYATNASRQLQPRPHPTERQGIPAAQIVAEGDYLRLGIKNGYNCLYFYGEEGSWKARMTNSDTTLADCEKRLDIEEMKNLPGTADDVLEVKLSGLGHPSEHYPIPSARWDWSDTNKYQYVGLTCGRAWCEVGPKGFTPSPTDPDTTDRTKHVKGWHDRQYLAVKDGTGKLRPSRILGTIYPDKALGSMNNFAGTWVDVATVALEAPPEEDSTAYLEKLNLAFTMGDNLNTIALCQSTDTGGAGCSFGEAVLKCTDTTSWWVKITRPSGQSAYGCVKRCDLRDAEIPGLVRWRWSAHDEGAWTRCAQGCCEVLGPVQPG